MLAGFGGGGGGGGEMSLRSLGHQCSAFIGVRYNNIMHFEKYVIVHCHNRETRKRRVAKQQESNPWSTAHPLQGELW